MIDYIRMQKKNFFIFAMLIAQALFCVVSFECLVQGSLMAVFGWISFHPVYGLYNLAALFLILWLLYVICNDLRWGYLFWQAVMLVFGAAESMKISERKEYIEFTDLFIAGEWGQAVSDVQFHGFGTIYVVAALLLVAIVFLSYTKPFWKRKRDKRRVLHSFLAVFIGIAVFTGGIYLPMVHVGIKERVVLGMQGELKGGMVCFLESIAYYGMTSEYSDDIYQDALDFFQAEAVGKHVEGETSEAAGDIAVKPNVIVIMSEALWDINQLSEAVSFNKNPMEAFDSLGGSYVQGKAATNIFGGGTDKSEFEFLTGWNSKYAVNGSSPYRDFFTRGQASMVQYLKALGYDCYSIHPYKGDFWGRDTAYANMGFDAFYDMYSMMYQNKYDVFISDAALTKEIIYRYEQQKRKTDAPVFSFNVSIANHVTKIIKGEAGPTCNDILVNYKIDYEKISDYNRGKLREYVNGVYTSGKALNDLIDYFSKVEEPTVIMVFGDHAPSFLSDFEPYVSEKIAKEAFYETPFYVWNNYGLGDFGEDEVNISYLSELLLEYIDFPLPKQAVLNKYLRSHCPVDTRFLVKDTLGNLLEARDDDYIERCYGASNAMHYALNKNSYLEMDIWTTIP